MYINNERGMTLLDITIALLVMTLAMTLGYKVLMFAIIESQTQISETEELLQISTYNRLFLSDIRDAKNLTYTEVNGKITLTYTTTKPKEIIFTPTVGNLYTLSYRGGEAREEHLLQLEKFEGTLPITYDPTTKALTLNHILSGITYNYTIYPRRSPN